MYRREFFIGGEWAAPAGSEVFGVVSPSTEGFKESGLGRELGPEGLANFLEPRSIGLPPGLHPR
jgi:acyl-CoA reductase-like NAD-dependent aldehyde dehydrogenase